MTAEPHAITGPHAGPGGPAGDRLSAGQAVPDQPAVRRAGTVRSWPLLVLAAPAAAEVWSGWVGVAQKTGFGLVSPLPGIWPTLHLDTSITLPVGVECYAALALRAWLSGTSAVSQARRFARRSAIFSFALGMAGQVAYHLMKQAGMTQAPWPVTTLVSCLPVLVLAMGTALAHMLHDDAAAATGHPQADGPAPEKRLSSPTDQESGPDRDPDQAHGCGPAVEAGPSSSLRGTAVARSEDAPDPAGQARAAQARAVAAQLATAGKPVSRRALRAAGIRGSNEALNDLARALRAGQGTRAALGGAP